MAKKISIIILILVGIYILNYFSPVHLTINGSCDYTAGMNPERQTCSCSGSKTVIHNDLPMDGVYETVCNGIGIVTRGKR